MWSSKKGFSSILLILAVLILFLFMLIQLLDIFNVVELGKSVKLSVELDEMGSALYSMLNSAKGLRNMEVIGNLYADQHMKIDFLQQSMEKLYGPDYSLKISFPDGAIIIGKSATGEKSVGTTFEVPLPGAGKSGYIKSEAEMRK